MENAIENLPKTIDEFLDFAISVTKNLQAVHKKHGVHGFICPENLNWESGSFKTEMADTTQKNEEILTDPALLRYASPEHSKRNDLQIDYRADLYSLGTVFYELLVGEPPFVSKDPLELIHSHLARDIIEPHKRRKDIPKQISSIIMHLLEKEVENRYQFVNGLQRDLEKCLHQWEQKGNIEEFELGKSDFSGKVSISKKIYGREKELNRLLESLEKISNGGREFFALSGYSGVGKTSLVHEYQKDARTKPNLFIEGKFDQNQKSKPYVAWIKAFNKLVNHLLMESRELLVKRKTEIQKALGTNGKVLTDVFQVILKKIMPN